MAHHDKELVSSPLIHASLKMPSQFRPYYVTEALLHVIQTASQLGEIVGIMVHYANSAAVIKTCHNNPYSSCENCIT
jgi:hypothetical protein